MIKRLTKDLDYEGLKYHFEPFTVGVVWGDTLIRPEENGYLVVILTGLDEMPVGLCNRKQVLSIIKSRKRWKNTRITPKR